MLQVVHTQWAEEHQMAKIIQGAFKSRHAAKTYKFPQNKLKSGNRTLHVFLHFQKVWGRESTRILVHQPPVTAICNIETGQAATLSNQRGVGECQNLSRFKIYTMAPFAGQGSSLKMSSLKICNSTPPALNEDTRQPKQVKRPS